MLSAERKLYILKKLESEQTIQVKQIAKELRVSESSIRRDLLELDDENKVDRIYGCLLYTSSFVIDIHVNKSIPFFHFTAVSTDDIKW